MNPNPDPLLTCACTNPDEQVSSQISDCITAAVFLEADGGGVTVKPSQLSNVTKTDDECSTKGCFVTGEATEQQLWWSTKAAKHPNPTCKAICKAS